MKKEDDYGSFDENTQFIALNYINSILNDSTNYAQRFVAFVVFTQLLYLFLFIVIRFFGWIGWFKTIPFIIFICFGIGIVFLLLFLFKGINAKALSFFTSGLLYFIISIFLTREIGTDISITDISLLGGWSAWNMLFSIIILMIGTVRTFLLGFIYDYKKH